MKLSLGDTYEHEFRFSQDDVIAFAQLTGDDNPLHLDPEYAATTPFKRPIIHGMLGASVFTKVIGTKFRATAPSTSDKLSSFCDRCLWTPITK